MPAVSKLNPQTEVNPNFELPGTPSEIREATGVVESTREGSNSGNGNQQALAMVLLSILRLGPGIGIVEIVICAESVYIQGLSLHLVLKVLR